MLAEITNFVEAITILLGTVVVSFVAIRYARRIMGMLERGEWKIQVGEASVSMRRFAEVVSGKINQLDAEQQQAEPFGRDVGSPAPLSSASKPTTERATIDPAPFQIRRVLWVTDVPEEFFLERFALQNNGITIDIRRTTDDALSSLARSRYGIDAIISDVSRTERGTFVGHAWKAILEGSRAEGRDVPLVVYDRAALIGQEIAEVVVSQDGKSAIKPDLMTSSTPEFFRYFRIENL